MDALKLLNDPIMFFDATKAFKEEVSQQVDKYIVRTKGVVFEEIEKVEEKLLAIEIKI